MSRQAARFEVVAGKGVGTSIVVEDELVLGRQFETAGPLAEDDEISRRHARLAFNDADGLFTIEDLGSTNGTFVNGARISSRQALSVGDTVELGGTKMIVRLLPSRGDETTVRTEARPPVMPDSWSPTGVPAQELESSVQSTTASFTVSAEALASQIPMPPDGSSIAPAEAATLDEAESSSVPVAPDEPESPSVPPAPDQPQSPSVPPALSLRLEVDFTEQHARIAVESSDETIWLVFERGAWRLAPRSDEHP